MLSGTFETSQDPIGPCEPLEQWGDISRHSVMAAFSSESDFGAHSVMLVRVCVCAGVTLLVLLLVVVLVCVCVCVCVQHVLQYT